MTGRRPSRAETAEAAAGLRRVLETLPAEDDSPFDASVRRRLEGSVIALDLAAGQTPEPPDHSP